MNNQATTKYGNVQKCPQCGEPIEPFAVKCNTCGYEFRNVQALQSKQKLADKIEAINLAYREKGSGIMGHNETKKWVEISETIKNFPIPTAKEDLLDFAITMQSKWKNESSWLSSVYKAKYDECVNKAKILFANDPSFAGIFKQAKKDRRGMSKQGKTLLFLLLGIALMLLLMFLQPIFF